MIPMNGSTFGAAARPLSQRNVAPMGQRAFGQAQPNANAFQNAAPQASFQPAAAPQAPVVEPQVAAAPIATGPTPNANAYEHAAPQAAFNQPTAGIPVQAAIPQLPAQANPQALANGLVPGINGQARGQVA